MRTVMTRELKGLNEAIEMCLVDYHYTDDGGL
jgi:glutathionyl-hydroquinone reductase